jgi:hypothetical protein
MQGYVLVFDMEVVEVDAYVQVLPPDVQLQRLSSPGLLTSHMNNATDSFVLYLKSGMLYVFFFIDSFLY